MVQSEGENSEQAAAQDHAAVDVPHNRGDYHEVRDPDERERDANVDLALILFRTLTIVTAVSAIMCMVVNLVSLLRSFRYHVKTFVAVLRIYTVVFAAFIAVAETEWKWLFRHWPYLEYWFGRGMLQIFVAVMTKALVGASWEVRFEIIMHDVAAYMLLGCGFIYSIAGLFCFRKLKRRRIQKKEFREQAVKDLEDLDKKRRDLQALLAAGA
ncbi:unnamed protein product [Calypogeia fissa]